MPQPPTIAEPRSMSDACYRCIHRRELPGDARSQCRHPATEAAHKNALAPLIAATGCALPLQGLPGINVIGDRHGIRMGWFSWPFNFSPTWLVQCDGFEASGEERKP